ncbi:uncharacterized protein LOC126993473 isoform X4 [Eriocheir sinensis]|uniref:uncharacterized protein LOC126993473 isoform X4 n=1 Tax=Eriocheir sinensis TaxID=95602 RepID=UPI0021C85466|nr:uncharacterized protein LOC126993473 isoform X4 [Eriocheir sinensis]
MNCSDVKDHLVNMLLNSGKCDGGGGQDRWPFPPWPSTSTTSWPTKHSTPRLTRPSMCSRHTSRARPALGPATASLVGSMCGKSAKVEFESVGLNHEGCVSGRLAVSLPGSAGRPGAPAEGKRPPETPKD